MPEYRYVIVGGGVAGAAAVEGIRERDTEGSILLIGGEQDLPYNRPPLSKQHWFGKKKVEDIFVHNAGFYAERGVDVRLNLKVVRVAPEAHLVRESSGAEYRYGKLLLATGGTPRRLSIPGGELEGVNYFRTLKDYEALRAAAQAGKSAVVIGGGFIGSELAAALTKVGIAVTLMFPGKWLVHKVFPEGLAKALTNHFREKGVRVLAEDVPVAIAQDDTGFVVETRSGQKAHAEIVVAGVGITPNVTLAEEAGLKVSNGIEVNEFLQTSDPDIYAAGDVAKFPEAVLGPRRIEHWDNAVSQGKHVGKNMAGAQKVFADLPFFFSDLFEFGYEAVGDVDSRLETFADWQELNKKGAIYYLEAGRVRGAMMCDLWDKVDEARKLIREGKTWNPKELRGAIR
jgi:NADPH-dependent 2,4-dienoyl-CoA reductase/sulfur reductase-like enzyme